jgi:hypothetical protein
LGNNLKPKAKQETKLLVKNEQKVNSATKILGFASLVGLLWAANTELAETKEQKERKLFDELFYYGFLEDRLQVLPKQYSYTDYYYDRDSNSFKHVVIDDNEVYKSGSIEDLSTHIKDKWTAVAYKDAVDRLSAKVVARIYVEIRDSKKS